MDIDVNAVRDASIALYGRMGAESAYAFYYDQPEVTRRRGVDFGDFRLSDPAFHMLGGIAAKGGERSPGVVESGALHAALDRGGPLIGDDPGASLLWTVASPKVGAFLDCLEANTMVAHGLFVDPLYWSAANIIDSLAARGITAGLQGIGPQLKDDLFAVLAAELGDTADLYRRFGFPDIDEARRPVFAGELLQRVEDRQRLISDFSQRMLTGVLAAERDTVPDSVFEGDGGATSIIGALGAFVIEHICLFRNARHRFSTDSGVRALLTGVQFHDAGRVLDGPTVADRTELELRASAALGELLGRFFLYAARTSPVQLLADRRALDPTRLRVLAKLDDLLQRTRGEAPTLLRTDTASATARGVRILLKGQ